MGSIVAGFTAAVDPSAAATALTGANIEAENNYLSEQKKAQKNEEIQACKSWACAATVQVKWAAIDAGQDASFYSGVVAVVPAGLYDAVLGSCSGSLQSAGNLCRAEVVVRERGCAREGA
ncbi:hypothetical protein CE205_07645 [Achromobacter insolitus]|nr:hypothetical protein CE205_07645 [Achromobacter insolitus]